MNCAPTFLLLSLAMANLIIAMGTTLLHADEAPNVLLILVDDMNDWVGCLKGHPDVETPNIDRLADRGTLFTNAHVAAPVCNPSRVATMTGLRPSTTGVYDNSIIWHQNLGDIETIPRYFKTHGYMVAGGGKVYHHMPGFNRRSDWHEYFDQVFDCPYQDQLARGVDVTNFQWPIGFPLNDLPAVKSFSKPPQNAREFDWGPMDKTDLEMGDGRMVHWAVEFLRKPPKEPFLLAAGIYHPHLPFYSPRDYFDRYPTQTITKPPIKADDLDDLPPAGRAMAEQRRGDYQLLMQSGKYEQFLQAYLAGISYADALVGRLLDALDASPVAENTVVVFWSDHGWHLGEKQHLHKFTLWERSTHIPFIIWAPGVSQATQRCERSVGTIDLFPTLCELCNLPVAQGLEGLSLLPLLNDPKEAWERGAITTHGQGNHSLRTDRWRYIRYADGGEELYDHSVDPHEWNNLADNPLLKDIKAGLAAQLPKSDAAPLKRRPN
ncbi:MAG: sulfatase [Planctomycetales bacterium]|nr:sulfatase [Planctomycetales bacterium]